MALQQQQQRSPGPFHYLINEQAKSLVALQELQNEVGALLEFRDLVMDTFPHLRTKLPTTPPPSDLPVALAASLGARREWEPGIRVRRKIPAHKDADARRKTVTSGETSSAGSSAVQDSGFSTETSSSKEQCNSGVLQSPKEATGVSSNIDEAEDELWNLLDVIHRKGTKLREEVESLQEKLSHEDKEKMGGFEEMCKTSLGGGEGLAFMGDILDIKDGMLQDFKPGGSMRCVMDADAPVKSQLLMNLDGDEARELRFERDYLLDKVSEMEAETLATREQAARLRDDLRCAVDERRDMEDQLRTAVSQKTELNSRIHDLHVKFVPERPRPIASQRSSFAAVPTKIRPLGFKAIKSEEVSLDSMEGFSKPSKVLVSTAVQCDPTETRMKVRLGTLDGVLSHPTRLPKGVVPDRRKVAAILNEFSPVELQRHLLATTVVNQDLQQRLDVAVTSNANLVAQLDKSRDENDDLRFRLEERSIELEGTRAQVRVLERLHKPSDTKPPDEGLHSVESTGELILSPRKRPSKIPLGTKTYVAPKPPAKPSKDSSTIKDSLTSNKGSVGRNSSFSQKNSLNGKTKDPPKRDSLKKCDSLTKNSFPSNVSLSRTSLTTKKDTSISSTGRKSLHRQLSTRRGSQQNLTTRHGAGVVNDDGSKTLQRSRSPDSLNTVTASTSPWHNSSSSDYFDSINNSSATASQPLLSCSELHSLNEELECGSSTRHEGMAELDSLEMDLGPAKALLLARNVWVTAECIDELY